MFDSGVRWSIFTYVPQTFRCNNERKNREWAPLEFLVYAEVQV